MTRPTLDAAQQQQVTAALGRWAAAHPTPDKPVIVTGLGVFSARDMAAAVADPDSERGAYIFRVFAKGLIFDEGETPRTLEDILASYDPIRAYEPARDKS